MVDAILTGESIAFIIFAILIISSAVLMINFTKVVHMVTSLAFTFLSLAGLYVLLHAEFLAFVQVLIYAGAVTILMIFGIMLTRHDQPAEAEQPRQSALPKGHHTLLFLGVVALFAILFYSIQQAQFPVAETAAGQDNALQLGELIFTRHVIPFEALSLLLTVAFIGAVILAKREEE